MQDAIRSSFLKLFIFSRMEYPPGRRFLACRLPVFKSQQSRSWGFQCTVRAFSPKRIKVEAFEFLQIMRAPPDQWMIQVYYNSRRNSVVSFCLWKEPVYRVPETRFGFLCAAFAEACPWELAQQNFGREMRKFSERIRRKLDISVRHRALAEWKLWCRAIFQNQGH